MRDVEILTLSDGRATFGRRIGLGRQLHADGPVLGSTAEARAFLIWYRGLGVSWVHAGLHLNRWSRERGWPQCRAPRCTARVEGGGLCDCCRRDVDEERERLRRVGKEGPHA